MRAEIEELETNSKIQNIRDLYRGISDFKKGYHENIYIRDSRRRTAVIYTDSRVTVQSLKNHRNHKSRIEEIRKKQ